MFKKGPWLSLDRDGKVLQGYDLIKEIWRLDGLLREARQEPESLKK